MKTVWVILLIVLLAGAQPGFTADSLCSTAPAKARCPCSHCERPSCCATGSEPVPQTPATPPAGNNSQDHSQLLAAFLTTSLSLPAADPPEPFAAFNPSLKATDIPLYARNCSYLL